MKGQFLHNSFLENYRRPLGARTLGERVTLSLRADSYDELSVKLCIYTQSEKYKLDMHRDELGRFTAELSLPLYPCVVWYNFEVNASGETAYYCPKNGYRGGIGSLFDNNINRFQITVCEKDFKTPDCYKGALMYQIFPDRFSTSGQNLMSGISAHKSRGRVVNLHETWNEDVVYLPADDEEFYIPNDYFGGDLKGITDNLEYIASLGVNVIYLNPIFEADSNHRYNTADYLRIDPLLGSEDDFIHLCKAAEDKNIKIIIDGVFSHTGSDSIYFKSALNGPENPYYSWYMFESFPDKYFCWWGFESLPEVNEHDGEWQRFIIDNEDGVIKKWLDKGAGGYRLDVADELPDDVISKMRHAVKSRGEDKLLLGEVWEDATTKLSYGALRKYALGGGLDSVMNYPFRNAVIEFLTGKADARELCNFLIEQQQNYHPEMYYCLMNLLSSHDVARIRTVLAKGEEFKKLSREEQALVTISDREDLLAAKLIRLALGISMTVPGMPSIYYGDECGMHGLMDPFNRRPFNIKDTDLLEYFRKWGNIRKSHLFSKSGFFTYVFDEDSLGLCRFISEGEDEFGSKADNGCVITFINRGNKRKTVCIDLQKEKSGISLKKSRAIAEYGYTKALSLFDGKIYAVNNGLLEFEFDGMGCDCLLLKKEVTL